MQEDQFSRYVKRLMINQMPEEMGEEEIRETPPCLCRCTMGGPEREVTPFIGVVVVQGKAQRAGRDRQDKKMSVSF